MVLSLRAESIELDPTMAAWNKFVDRFIESMTKFADQFVEDMKQACQKSNPKHDRKVLICGYTEEQDCFCEATDSLNSVYQDNNDEDNGDLDFKEEESRQRKLQIRQDGDQVIPEVGDHEDLLTKIVDPSSPITQVCAKSIHDKINSLPKNDFLSPFTTDNIVGERFYPNQKERKIADKVFDESPKQNGYTDCLNPKPPDVYDAVDDLINYGFNAPAQLETEESIYPSPKSVATKNQQPSLTIISNSVLVSTVECSFNLNSLCKEEFHGAQIAPKPPPIVRIQAVCKMFDDRPKGSICNGTSTKSGYIRMFDDLFEQGNRGNISSSYKYCEMQPASHDKSEVPAPVMRVLIHGNSRLDISAIGKKFKILIGWFLDPMGHGDCPSNMKALVKNGFSTYCEEEIFLMQIHDDEAFVLYDKLFSYACPKYIALFASTYEKPVINCKSDSYRLQLKLFPYEMEQQQLLYGVQIFLKVYTTNSFGKLATYMEVNEFASRTILMTYKHKIHVDPAGNVISTMKLGTSFLLDYWLWIGNLSVSSGCEVIIINNGQIIIGKSSFSKHMPLSWLQQYVSSNCLLVRMSFVDMVSSVVLGSTIMDLVPVVENDAILEKLLLLFFSLNIFSAQGKDPKEFFIITKGCDYEQIVACKFLGFSFDPGGITFLTIVGECRDYLQSHLEDKVVVDGWGSDTELIETKLVAGVTEKKILLGAIVTLCGSAKNELNICNYMNSTYNLTDAISRSFCAQSLANEQSEAAENTKKQWVITGDEALAAGKEAVVPKVVHQKKVMVKPKLEVIILISPNDEEVKKVEDESQIFYYMDSRPKINERGRAILVDWLIEFHNKFELMSKTLYLTINIVGRYLATKTGPRKGLQLVGISTMLMAPKYEEIWALEVNDFVGILDNVYTFQQVLIVEKRILGKLEGNVTVPTPYVFLVHCVKASSTNMKQMRPLASRHGEETIWSNQIFSAQQLVNRMRSYAAVEQHHLEDKVVFEGE